MNKYDRKYIERQIKTVAELRKLYNDAYKKIIAGIPLTKLSQEEQFAFEKYPELEKKFNQTARALDVALLAYINSSTREVWDFANEKNTEIINNQFAGKDSKPPIPALKTNIPEYEKFVNRKIGDLTLSDRVWNINGTNFKEEIELAINAAIREGTSAANVSRDIRKYLNNPDALFRRVRDAEGNLQLSKAAKEYKPGQGVYRSAYKNALRLARTEINTAYRESDYLRMQENDSIIGFRIQNSNRIATVCELCKRFDGLIFPKTFRWLGFHVQCMCTSTAVFASDAEVAAWKRGEEINPELPKMPDEFVKYQGELQGTSAKNATFAASNIEASTAKSQSAMDREKYLKEMDHLLDKKIIKEVDDSRIISIRFTKKGNKHLYSDSIGRIKDFQKEDLKKLHLALEKSIFVKSAELSKIRKDDITKFYYFKDADKKLFYNVAEEVKKGKVHRYMYSMTNLLKK